jgi:exopolysaccharide biosynthesis WecB/TagA/CpsF family protein
MSTHARALETLRLAHSNWVNIPDQMTLLDTIQRKLAARSGFSVATLNLDFVVKLKRDATFRDALKKSDIVTADGFPIVWACRVAGIPAERTTGADLVVPVARCAADLGVPVSIVGTTQEVLDQAITRLRALVPGLRTGLLCAPRLGFSADTPEAGEILARLDALGPNICFLALGAPKQELLAARGRGLAPQTGFMCVGAGIDFIAGRQKRASPIVQALNLEWAWRLAREPRRLFMRYFNCILALPSLLTSALRARYAR